MTAVTTTISEPFEFPSGLRVTNRLFKSAMSEQLGLSNLLQRPQPFVK